MTWRSPRCPACGEGTATCAGHCRRCGAQQFGIDVPAPLWRQALAVIPILAGLGCGLFGLGGMALGLCAACLGAAPAECVADVMRGVGLLCVASLFLRLAARLSEPWRA
ncbi:MAG: hypothetical protein IT204_04160 [Fimbriimonadaceae bacterium]|nr:hypothetical protein [Fimbriimonadaceae bacterium]